MTCPGSTTLIDVGAIDQRRFAAGGSNGKKPESRFSRSPTRSGPACTWLEPRQEKMPADGGPRRQVISAASRRFSTRNSDTGYGLFGSATTIATASPLGDTCQTGDDAQLTRRRQDLAPPGRAAGPRPYLVAGRHHHGLAVGHPGVVALAAAFDRPRQRRDLARVHVDLLDRELGWRLALHETHLRVPGMRCNERPISLATISALPVATRPTCSVAGGPSTNMAR